MLRSFSLSIYIVCFILWASSSTLGQTKSIDAKVDSILSLMTLEDKVGQMNQYNGFWDITGPATSEGDARAKYDHIRSGLVGAWINIQCASSVRNM